MSLATGATIRDRIRDLISYTDPLSLTVTRFRDSRNELKGDFRTDCEANPAGCFRRYQVRNVGDDPDPAVSNCDYEQRELTVEVVIAYPQTNRAGSDNAMDRDDVIEEDWDEINFQIGLCGRANFGSTNDCTPMGHNNTKTVERGDSGVDFLVVRFSYTYQRYLAVGGLVGGLPAGLGGG